MKLALDSILNILRGKSSAKVMASALAGVLLLALAVPTAFAQCTLTSPDTWSLGANGSWTTSGNWSGGTPTSSTNACITDGTSTVDLGPGLTGNVASLQLASGNILNITLNSDLIVSGTQVINGGQINIDGGSGTNSLLIVNNNVTLSGGGTLTLNTASGGGNAYIDQAAGGLTLTNQSTIDGAGIIGNNGLALNNSGTVNANQSGQVLYLSGVSSNNTNSGLMEATNGGVLNVNSSTYNNAGGTFKATTGGTVNLYGNVVIQGGTLTNSGGAFLGTVAGNSVFLDGSTASGAVTLHGTYTSQLNTNTYVLGTINNNNSLLVNGGNGTNALLIADSTNVTLQGGGTVTMQSLNGGGNAYIDQASGGLTITNVNNTIQGDGIIGNNGLAFVNQAGGVINANSTGVGELASLTIQGASSFTNAGLMEATNNGVLNLNGLTINNAGGNITATGSGASVQIYGSTVVQGGNLNNNGGAFFGTPQGNSAVLDGSTVAGAITINGAYTSQLNTNTYVLGTINNKNSIFLAGGAGTNTQLLVDSSSVTLQGGGTVTMQSLNGGGAAYIDQAAGNLTLTNVNNTIQGDGILGNNGLTVINQATINANSNGGTELTSLTIQGTTAFTNTGLLEATNSGVLNINGVTVNNQGGNISANGSGASVQLYGSTDIEGGTLNNNGGAFLGTLANNSAVLDGSTGSGAVTINGTYTAASNTNTYLLGTINNKNNLLVIGGNGFNTQLLADATSVSLQGGGTVTMQTLTGGGNAFIDQAAGGLTLTNVNNTIQGDGILGNNGLTIVNQATINANSNGGAEINTLTLQGASATNTGLIEATNSGVLNINGVAVVNAGGNITANGGSASVQLYGSTSIEGGTLNNNGGAFFGTPVNSTAYLDGSTASGMVTINGTYTGAPGSNTHLLGTINNHGNILINGGAGSNTQLFVDNSVVTLQGGGTVTLNTQPGGGSVFLDQVAGGLTLDNVDNTIQGNGIIGNNGLSLTNGAAGTVLANVSGGTLLINGGGTVTNNGTFQADAGSLLHLTNVTFTNFGGSTLTGGTYNVYGTGANPGTLQIDPLGNTGGEIVNNAATIYLNGPNSNFVDQAGLDALSKFSNNTASGSFTITNGRNFTSPSTTNFANAGAVTVGSGSTFTTGGTRNYVQSGGSTQLSGGLVAGGGQANFNGGVLFGNGGTVTGNVTMAGTIAPAATINGSNVPTSAGGLTISGNYTQTPAGIFNLGLGGLAPGSQFGFLSVSGNAQIDGTLNVNLLGSFFPAVGNTFTFLTTGGTVTGTFATTNGLNIGGGEILNVIYGSNFIELSTGYSSTTDLWLGGTGVWSNGSKWSIGVPQPAFDTIIYSGGNDLVTMDVGSSTVNSLTVGGPTNGFTSTLTDGGIAQTLTITNGLTIGAQGVLSFTSNGGSLITAATASNSGSVTLGPADILNLTAQPNGVTSVPAGASWDIGGNFAVSGVANTGFANLSSLAGTVKFDNGATQSITPALTIASTGLLGVGSGTTLNMASVNNSGQLIDGINCCGGSSVSMTGLTNNAGGLVDLEMGSKLTVNGNVTNNGTGVGGIYTSLSGNFGNTIQITGALTNGGTFQLFGSGDQATIGSLTNNAGGFVDVESLSTLNVTGNVINNAAGPAGIYTSFNGTGNNTINIGGTLTNNGKFGLESTNDQAKVTGAVTNSAGALFALTGGSSATFSSTLLNNGQVDAENASSLKVTGATTNNGTLSASAFSGTGGNTMTFTALLTNNGGAQISLNNNDTLKAPGGIANTGTITVKNGSTVDPPFINNIGIVNVDSTSTFVVGTGAATGPGYVQLANGTLGEMISNSNFGQIFSGSSASLNGTLDIMLQGGFNPAVGTTYDIILFSPGGLSGSFSTILNQIFNGGTEIWQVNYNNTGGYVQLTAASNGGPTTPEPGTFLLFGSSLLGVAYAARRRWLK
jgi:hypothetical protein